MPNSGFRPDWVSAPGDTIADILEERRLSSDDLAAITALSAADTTALLQGRLPLTEGIAARLEAAFEVPTRFWLTRETTYRKELVRLEAKQSGDVAREWAKQLPIRDMVRFGWLDRDAREHSVESCLRFFGTPDLDSWRAAYRDVINGAAFRKSPSYKSNPLAVAAWLRQGERATRSLQCQDWDSGRFETILSDIRVLTRKKYPRVFLPELVRRCADCGVAVAVVPAPRGCRISGATRFLSRRRALLLLSIRHGTDDQFWFTFFHEAAHLLLHGERGFFLEGPDALATKEETQANEYAANLLVPAEALTDLESRTISHDSVLKVARSLAVSPGIVVGQLQHLGKVPRNHFNGLKRRYAWDFKTLAG
jgi:plasmid maintenance system antidote protein VapI